jgi:hypothetical protein
MSELDFDREKPAERDANSLGSVVVEDRFPHDLTEIEILIGPRREIFTSTAEIKWYEEARSRQEELAARTLKALHAASLVTPGVEV